MWFLIIIVLVCIAHHYVTSQKTNEVPAKSPVQNITNSFDDQTLQKLIRLVKVGLCLCCDMYSGSVTVNISPSRIDIICTGKNTFFEMDDVSLLEVLCGNCPTEEWNYFTKSITSKSIIGEKYEIKLSLSIIPKTGRQYLDQLQNYVSTTYPRLEISSMAKDSLSIIVSRSNNTNASYR